MTEDQETELRHIRTEQDLLRQQWSRLEERLLAVEAAARGLAPAPTPRVEPMPRPEPSQVAVEAAAVPAPHETPSPPPSFEPLRESLEMRIGTVWLVRAGIVLLLTSLAFAGNYLYQNVVPHLGPRGKVALLYAAAGLLTGLGAWLERSRQARELVGLQNYARVVLAGGLAAIYYVTYAAHYYPHLRVIESPLLAGLLLLGWAVFLVWLADRRASEILATIAILLAYYTSAINEIASFTLFSNLVLTGGAVYLLRRHLWRIFPFASLLATFGSYGYWHYFYAPLWVGPERAATALHTGGGFWLEGSFLFVYWALFTWAVFTTDDGTLPAARRATFASLNNGAFFVLTTWLLLGDYPTAFWRWSLAFGVLLAGLGELGRRRRPPLEAASENAYQLQSALLVTLGFIDYFSGWQLSIILAVQSRVLLDAASRRRNTFLLVFAWLTALWAFLCAAFGLVPGNPAAESTGSWIAALVVGAFCLEESWRCEQLRRGPPADLAASPAAADRSTPLRFAAAYFAVLGSGIWCLLLERKITFEPAVSPSLATAAVGFLLLSFVLRVAALPLLAQGYLLLAQAQWLQSYGGWHEPSTGSPPWWNFVALMVLTLAFGEAAQRAPLPALETEARRLFQSLLISTMVLGTLCGWCYVGSHLALLPGGAFNVPARWSLYAAAVFVVGLALHERVYRWLGLLILAATLGRVVLIDIWQIDLLERALSFLTLGIVLLGLGFFYTRFGSKVRDLF